MSSGNWSSEEDSEVDSGVESGEADDCLISSGDRNMLLSGTALVRTSLACFFFFSRLVQYISNVGFDHVWKYFVY